MTLKEACQQTGRSESTIRHWIRTGKLKAALNDIYNANRSKPHSRPRYGNG